MHTLSKEKPDNLFRTAFLQPPGALHKRHSARCDIVHQKDPFPLNLLPVKAQIPGCIVGLHRSLRGGPFGEPPAAASRSS